METCSICLEDIEMNKPNTFRKTVCNHYFHRGCLDHWINTQNKRTCPNCRTQIVNGNNINRVNGNNINRVNGNNINRVNGNNINEDVPVAPLIAQLELMVGNFNNLVVKNKAIRAINQYLEWRGNGHLFKHFTNTGVRRAEDLRRYIEERTQNGNGFELYHNILQKISDYPSHNHSLSSFVLNEFKSYFWNSNYYFNFTCKKSEKERHKLMKDMKQSRNTTFNIQIYGDHQQLSEVHHRLRGNNNVHLNHLQTLGLDFKLINLSPNVKLRLSFLRPPVRTLNLQKTISYPNHIFCIIVCDEDHLLNLHETSRTIDLNHLN